MPVPVPEPAAVVDLTSLDAPSEDAICAVLKARLLTGQIYTGMSAMLLAVNPCEWLPGLYSDRTLQRYLGSESDPPPHVFRTAAALHRGMTQGRSQSVVISGESGAGKTQTFKRLMQFISAATAGSARSMPVSPKNVPPAMTATMTTTGWRPTLWPTTRGVMKLPSRNCAMANVATTSSPTHPKK